MIGGQDDRRKIELGDKLKRHEGSRRRAALGLRAHQEGGGPGAAAESTGGAGALPRPHQQGPGSSLCAGQARQEVPRLQAQYCTELWNLTTEEYGDGEL